MLHIRKVKCQICKKELLKSQAYLLEIKKVVNDKEKVTRRYYCSEKEYNDYKYELECKDNFFKKMEELFGDKVINTYLFKLYAELKDYKHSDIYKTLLNKEKNISHALNSTVKTNNQTNKLQYVFAIVKNNIADEILKKGEQNQLTMKVSDEFDEIYEVMNKVRKVTNKRRSIRDIIREGK